MSKKTLLIHATIWLGLIVGCVVTMSIEPSPAWQQQNEMRAMRRDIERERKEIANQKRPIPQARSIPTTRSSTVNADVREGPRLCWVGDKCTTPDNLCCHAMPTWGKDGEPLAQYIACDGKRDDADGNQLYWFKEFCPPPWAESPYHIHAYGSPSAMLEKQQTKMHASLVGDVFPPGGDGTVDVDDLICTFMRFGGATTCIGGFGPVGADMYPCGGGDGLVDVDDLIAVNMAFANETVCP